jgi:hypothetical protein
MGGIFSASACVTDVGDVSLSTAAIASSKYAVFTDVCFVVTAEVCAVVVDGGAGGGGAI